MIAILYLTHVINAEVLRRFALLSGVPGHESLILYDATRAPAPVLASGTRLHEFRLSDIYRSGYHPLERSIKPGSEHFPAIEFLVDNPQFEYAWCVEFDAIFCGDWSVFLEAHKSKADLLAAYVTRRTMDPHWMWWRSLSGPKSLAADQMVRSFNPVYRISTRAAAVLRREYLAGWVGHYEVSMATLVRLHGLTIEDLGNQGEFVREANRGRWYQPQTYSAERFPLERIKDGSRLLAHPVKIRSMH